VNDRLVVVADGPAESGLDLGQGALVGWLHGEEMSTLVPPGSAGRVDYEHAG
jgi:hypothetical protein